MTSKGSKEKKNIEKLMKQNDRNAETIFKEVAVLQQQINEKNNKFYDLKMENLILYDISTSEDEYGSFCGVFIMYGYCSNESCLHLHKTRQWIDDNRPKCPKGDECKYFGRICNFSHKLDFS